MKLDGKVIATSEFAPISGTKFSVDRLAINKGAHRAQSGSPAGVWVYGYDYAVSYGYAAGARF